MKKIILLTGILSLLLAGLCYFFYFPCKIGTPCHADICYTDATLRQRKAITLNAAQTEQLADILKDATPTLFIQEPPGMGGEDILITLHYEDGTRKTISLWHVRSVLYEGDAENMTMSSMMGASIIGELLHFGGNTDADRIQDLLRSAGADIEVL